MFRSKTQFEKVLDKATSNLLLEPDFDSMLQLCDMIRGGDIKARDAVAHVKSRITEEKNPNVKYFTLSVLDTVMKNCGESVHGEVINQNFLEELKDMLTTSNVDRVKEKILDMIQAWGIAFKLNTELKIASNLYTNMKAEGYDFPPPTNTADMFKSEKAPVWKDGDECFKCKTVFGLVQRKHHCRACGGIFCKRCTTKLSAIPKFGIEKEVRVCDKCYDEISIKSSSSRNDSNALPSEYLNSALAKETQVAPSRNTQVLKEEEELQLVLAMSLNEQENQPRAQQPQTRIQVTIDKNAAKQPQVNPARNNDLDPELARYLNRNYWERKKNSQEEQVQPEAKKETKKMTPSALLSQENKDESESTTVIRETLTETNEPEKIEESLQNGVEIEDNEEFLHNLRTSVEIFMNRMRSNQMRNRSIANDSAVQSLFQNINTMHPTLLNFMNDLEEKRLQSEALQDKLTQIRDARAALEALREEHKEKLRFAAEEAERTRQIQMAQKLEIMRRKKQEYLAYQRQLALQRMQEQEAERHARLERQKQFVMQRAMQPAMLVQGYNTQYLLPQPNVGESATDTQVPSMQHAGYPPYIEQGYQQHTVVQTSTGQLPYAQQAPVAALPGHYPPHHVQHTGQYALSQSTAYQPTPPDHGGQSTSVQGGMLSQDSYNMSGMASALPQQVSMMGQPQVVATAPPSTPQSTPTPQQMTQLASQPHMMHMGGVPSSQQQQQQYYQQPHQGQHSSNTQVPPALQQQARDFLISFE